MSGKNRVCNWGQSPFSAHPFFAVKKIRFFSTLVGEEGPRIPGVKDSRVCFLKTLSAPLAFHSNP
jgi:hypothetical protein